MDKFTDYINKHSIEEVVAAIVDNKKDIKKAIKSIRQSRSEYQKKTQYIQWELEKLDEQE